MHALLVTAALLAQLETGPVPFDVSAIKADLKVLTDGKGHYLAFNGKEPFSLWFVGDGKTFNRMRVPGGGGTIDEQWDVSFWDPRLASHPFVAMKEGGKKWDLSCGKKSTSLTQLKGDELKKLVDEAKFLGPSWTRQPERLLRDDAGTYYFVDRLRTDENERRDFVFYRGARGKLKAMKLKDIVDDSKGLILATKDGSLRLVAGQGEKGVKWVEGKKETTLVEVPLDDPQNARLVYNELGVYDGKRLGTPCDDLM